MKVNQRSQLRVNRLIKERAGKTDEKLGNLGIWPFSPWYSGMTDFEVGEEYLKMFFDSSSYLNTKMDYDLYIATMRKNKGTIYADGQVAGLGLGIKLAEMSKGSVQEAADTLAELSNGLTPASIGDFRQALVGNATATPFTDAVLTNPAVLAAAKIGDTIISAADTTLSLVSSTVEGVGMMAKIVSYMPIILPIGIGFGIYKLAKSDLGKGLMKKAITGGIA